MGKEQKKQKLLVREALAAKRFKELKRRLPDEIELNSLLSSLTNVPFKEPIPASPAVDRNTVIVAAAAVEHKLRNEIAMRLAPDLTDAEREAVFDNFPSAPLGSFSSKILMGRALGLITAEEKHDLDIVRGIRNHFGHSVHPHTVSDPAIAAEVAKMKVWEDKTWEDYRSPKFAVRDHFVVACVILYVNIDARPVVDKMNARSL